MENSILLARIIGPYCVIVAIGILLNQKIYQTLMEDFCKNAALVYIGGIFALLFGLLVVQFHNKWVADWTVIITIFGWMGIIKGIWLLIFPDTIAKFTEVYQKKSSLLIAHLILVLVIGLVLSVLGYVTV